MIREYMPLAKRIGLRYASRHSKHPDEAVAEAYYHLVILFLEKRILYENAIVKERLVGAFVKRATIKYFEKRGSRENVILRDKIVRNTDEEMIEWLSGLLPDEAAFKVFKLIRDGVDLFDVEMLDPQLIKVAKRLRLQVTGRITRLEKMAKMGVKTSRRIEYDHSLDDIEEQGPEASCETGERTGRNDPANSSGKSSQPENTPTLAH